MEKRSPYAVRSSRSTRRAVLRGGSVVAGASLAAACGGPAQSSQPAPTPAVPSGPVDLTFLTWGGGERLKIWQDGVLGGFMKKYPNIKAHLLAQPGTDQVKATIITGSAAGTAPDVVRLSGEWSAGMYNAGLMRQLDPFVRSAKLRVEDQVLPPYDGAQWKGKWFALPHGGAGNNVVFYNVDLVQQMQVPPPTGEWTFDQFTDTARRMTKVGGDYGSSVWGTEIGSLWRWYYGWLWAQGAQELSQDGTKCLLDQPAAVDTIQWIADLRHRQQVAPRADQIPKGAPDLFLSGRVAMYYTGTWYEVTAAAAPFDWTYVSQPKGKAGQWTFSKPNNAAMTATKQPDASWLLLQHLISDDNARLEAQTGLNGPNNPRLVKEESFLAPAGPPHDRRPAVPNLLIKTRGVTFAPGYDDALTARQEGFGPMLNGDVAAQVVARDVARRMEQILADALKPR